jgi:hypothetical protein
MTNLEPKYALDVIDEVEGVTAVCQELSSFEEPSS